MNNKDRRAIWANKYFAVYEPGMHPRRPYVIAHMLHDTTNQARYNWLRPSRKSRTEQNVIPIKRRIEK